MNITATRSARLRAAAYTGCETIIEDDIDGTGCKMTFGESKGGTCACPRRGGTRLRRACGIAGAEGLTAKSSRRRARSAVLVAMVVVAAVAAGGDRGVSSGMRFETRRGASVAPVRGDIARAAYKRKGLSEGQGVGSAA